MSEQTYSRLQAFVAAGGQFTLEPNFVYPIGSIGKVATWQCELEFKGIQISNAIAANPDAAVFFAFDTLHQALPSNVIKW